MNKEELILKANKILEDTKKRQKEYSEERIVIFKLLDNLDTEFHVELLERIIRIIEKNI